MNYEDYNIYSKLFNERIVFITGEINDNLSNSVISRLLLLESINKKLDINVYINSPGGSITSGIAIYDTMKYIKPDVSTVCIGIAASMGAFILSSGSKGKRYSLPNSRIMIHQPYGGFRGTVSDIKIQTKEIIYLKKKINNILSKNTNRNLKKIYKDTKRDFFMSPKKAKLYGLIDKIL
ncbi:ATP-dependent Clp protease proteolytic subunit [Candidatus Vidania fulgoroideorum]